MPVSAFAISPCNSAVREASVLALRFKLLAIELIVFRRVDERSRCKTVSDIGAAAKTRAKTRQSSATAAAVRTRRPEIMTAIDHRTLLTRQC